MRTDMRPRIDKKEIREEVWYNIDKRSNYKQKKTRLVVDGCPRKGMQTVNLDWCERCRFASLSEKQVRCSFMHDTWEAEVPHVFG